VSPGHVIFYFNVIKYNPYSEIPNRKFKRIPINQQSPPILAHSAREQPKLEPKTNSLWVRLSKPKVDYSKEVQSFPKYKRPATKLTRKSHKGQNFKNNRSRIKNSSLHKFKKLIRKIGSSQSTHDNGPDVNIKEKPPIAQQDPENPIPSGAKIKNHEIRGSLSFVIKDNKIQDPSRTYSPGGDKDNTLTIIPVNHSPPPVKQPHKKGPVKIINPGSIDFRPVRKTAPKPAPSYPQIYSNTPRANLPNFPRAPSNTSINSPTAPQVIRKPVVSPLPLISSQNPTPDTKFV